MRRVSTTLTVAVALTVGGPASAQVDPSVASRTAFLYQMLDARRVEPGLWLTFTDDPHAEARELAVRVLASVGDPDHARLLAEFADDPDANVRREVMVAAGRIGPPAFGIAARGLRDVVPMVRQGAVWALCHMGGAGLEPVVAHLGRERAPAVVETALGNLWRFGDAPWVEVAARYATDRDPILRRAAAAGLARGGGHDALALLARDEEPVIRTTAVAGFARGPWRPAWQAAVAASLRDPDWRVRAAACAVLATRPEAGPSDGDREVLRAQIDAVEPHLRVAALRAAAIHPGVMSPDALRGMAVREQPWIAGEALLAATALDPEGTSKLLGEWLGDESPEWRRRSAARAAVLLPKERREQIAATVVSSGDAGVQLAWLDAVSALDPAWAVETVRGLLDAPDPMVRSLAVDVLHDVGAVDGSDTALELAARWRDDEIPDARAAAWTAALELAEPERRAELVELAFGEPDDGLRTLVAETARGLGLPVVAPPREARHGQQWYRDLVDWAADAHALDVVTVRGTLRIVLDTRSAPLTAREIADLAATGFYDGLDFHRVVPNFVVQGGDPRGDGWGGPGFTLADEPSMMPFDMWRVGIATSGRHTGGCQLFAMLLPSDRLTGHYTNIGEVSHGRGVLERLQVGDRIVRVEVTSPDAPPPDPLLVGDVTADQLFELEAWSPAADDPPLDPEALARLRASADGARLVTVLGTWCHDSVREVPALLRVLAEVDGLDHRMVAVDRTKRLPRDDELASLAPGGVVDRVPTVFVLDRDGRLRGAVVESADGPWERRLADLLEAPNAP
jgi:cyclophilin family peptidyl-prolyl cis-trans isomerase/HEAT repeat protein